MRDKVRRLSRCMKCPKCPPGKTDRFHEQINITLPDQSTLTAKVTEQSGSKLSYTGADVRNAGDALVKAIEANPGGTAEHAHYLDSSEKLLVTMAATMESGPKFRLFGSDDWIAMIGALCAESVKQDYPESIVWLVGVENTNVYDYTLEFDITTAN